MAPDRHSLTDLHRATDDVTGVDVTAGWLAAADGAGNVEFIDPATVGSPLTVQDEGTPLATAATTLNFVGAGVTASGATATKTITVPTQRTFTFFGG